MGSIMYATVSTWPNIAYATNSLCAFNSNPNMEHWTAAKRLLKYLKGTKNMGITYKWPNNNTNVFYIYSDASFTNETNFHS